MEIGYGNIMVRRFSVMPGKPNIGGTHEMDHMVHLDIGEGDWYTYNQDEKEAWKLKEKTHHIALSNWGDDVIYRNGRFYELLEEQKGGLLVFKMLQNSAPYLLQITENIDLDCKMIYAHEKHSFYAKVPSVLSCTFSHVDAVTNRTIAKYGGHYKAYE